MVGFFILQYAKQRLFELYYSSFKKCRDADKYGELAMDIGSLYLAQLDKILEDVFPLKCQTSGM